MHDGRDGFLPQWQRPGGGCVTEVVVVVLTSCVSQQAQTCLHCFSCPMCKQWVVDACVFWPAGTTVCVNTIVVPSNALHEWYVGK